MASLITEGESRTGCQWLRILTLLILMFVLTAVSARAETAALRYSSVSANSIPVFRSVRHPDTTQTRGSYEVEVRQISGPDATGGYVVYEVSNATGERTGSGRVGLSMPFSKAKHWTGALPGQPPGSVITYHYLLLTQAKHKIRHPSDPSANYRFRINRMHLTSLHFQRTEMEAGLESDIVLTIEAQTLLLGEMILRLLPQKTQERDLHINLQIDTVGDATNGFREKARARLPALIPGQVADFYFLFRSGNGHAQTVPSDAPNAIFSVKRSVSTVRCIPVTEQFVLGTMITGNEKWLALRGGGTWNIDSEGGLTHWGTCDGGLSNVSRFAVSNDHSSFTYVGSDQGVVGVNRNIEIPLVLLRPEPSAWERTDPVFTTTGHSLRVGPAAASTLDGTILFQYQQEHVLEERFPQAFFFQIDSDRLSRYSFPNSGASRIVGFSSASFDAESGCWLLGGFVLDKEESLSPTAIRRCGESVRQIPLQEFRDEGSSAKPQRVIAIATDPTTSSMVVALEFQMSDSHKPSYGIFRLQEGSGQLIPIASAFNNSATEITCIGTDWNKGRILMGTFGKGLWQIREGTASRLQTTGNSPPEVTSLTIDDFSGGVVFGTSEGAYEIDGQDLKPIMPSLSNGLPADSMPMDARNAGTEVLFSSYSAGLAMLGRDGPKGWHPQDSWLRKARIPGAHFGDAQFTTNNGIAAVVYSEGLLLGDDKGMRVVAPKDARNSANLFRVLALRSGEIWLAYRPLPFGTQSGGAIQVLKDGELVDTFKMPDRGTATIGRWIELPERRSIFAATRDGVVEIRRNGSMVALSPNPATSIARNSATGLVGAVGSTVERWDGQKFVPLFYQVVHPRRPRAMYSPGSPIDIAFDNRNFWYVLYNHGVLAILDSKFQFLNILDIEDGIPQTSQRLLTVPGTADVFIGSTSEGVVTVSAAEGCHPF